jgi:hypothetical protein
VVGHGDDGYVWGNAGLRKKCLREFVDEYKRAHGKQLCVLGFALGDVTRPRTVVSYQLGRTVRDM